MISVGVDVQAARADGGGRAAEDDGRVHPGDEPRRAQRNRRGSCCTVFNWARPRDLSHYERFEHYHATFYQHVEALSVTPFAPRALDRGLSALLASLVRLPGTEFNANASAGQMDRSAAIVQAPWRRSASRS